MRVGFIAYALDRPLSGISRYSVELVRALLALDDAPEIFLLTAGGPGPLDTLNIRPVALRGCERLPVLLTLGSALIRKFATQLKLDMIHDPTGICPFLFGTRNVPTVTTIHDVIPLSFPGVSTRLDSLIYYHWLPHRLPVVSKVLTGSDHSKKDIMHHYHLPETKIESIPIGVNSSFQPVEEAEIKTVRTRYGLRAQYILFVGSVEERKNLRRVLEAYKQLRAQGVTHQLVIAGARKWHYASILQASEELDLENNVLFTSYVEEVDLPALYAGADVFVFPSLYEGFGLPVLEAMACGTPVVTSNASSLPQVAGDAALQVNAYDVDALATAIYRLLTNHDLHRMLRERGIVQAQTFRWERTARSTLHQYRALLSS